MQSPPLTTLLAAAALLPAIARGTLPPPPAPPAVAAGFARADITPDFPIRLAGYTTRKTETVQVLNRIYARVLALAPIGRTGAAPDPAEASVLVAVELVGVPASLSDGVAAALNRRHGIDRAHVAVCAVHTHTAPEIEGMFVPMFGAPLPPDQAEHVHRYRVELEARLVAAAEDALRDLAPARLSWGQGTVAFATNRRDIRGGKWVGFGTNLTGAADRALPLLRIDRPDGSLRGVLLSYACHNTTHSGYDNYIDGDWAGDASRRIEAGHAGCTALIALGCAGDTNPAPREPVDYTAQHGLAVATETDRLLNLPLTPLGPVTTATLDRLTLPLDHAVTREELETRLRELEGRRPNDLNAATAFNARLWLAALKRGEPSPEGVPFAFQTWKFGDRLAMVFLSGEVVSEYSLRLKREFGAARLWVNAYANDQPCYVASAAMIPEGGYEVDASMNFYGWPTRLSPRAEETIMADARRSLAGWAAASR